MLTVAGGIILAVVVLLILAHLLTEHSEGFIASVAAVVLIAMLAVGFVVLRAILLP